MATRRGWAWNCILILHRGFVKMLDKGREFPTLTGNSAVKCWPQLHWRLPSRAACLSAYFIERLSRCLQDKWRVILQASIIHNGSSAPSQHKSQANKKDRMGLAGYERNLSYPPDIGHCWNTDLRYRGGNGDPHHLIDRRLSIH